MDSRETTPTEIGLPAIEDSRDWIALDDYELGEELGKGGMGVVYEATQISLNRKVAIKMLPSVLLAGDDAIERFRKEAEATAAIDHPNIVPVYEVGETDGQPFMVMKLIEGQPLSKRIRQLQGKPREAANLMSKVCDAVHAAHQNGILHRDLKPGNILIDANTGEPHVADFGLAKRIDEDPETKLTLTGEVLGTPGYMSPEQAAGERVSTAADVYGLGAILYELLTGKAPFGGQNVAQILRQIEEETPARPATTTKGVDRDLEAITMKCLEKKPGHRYDSASELAEDLRRWQRREPVLARNITGPQRLVRWAGRKPLQAAFTAVLTAFLLTLAIAGPMVAVNQSRLRDEASAGQEELRRKLYASEMSQATTAPSGLDHRDAVDEILRKWIPKPEEQDLRGWEWRFLKNRKSFELKRYLNVGKSVQTLEFSPDKSTFVVGLKKGIQLRENNAAKKLIWELELDREGKCFQAKFSADGAYIAVMLSPRVAIAVLDAKTGEEIKRFRSAALFSFSNHVAWCPTEPVLAVHFVYNKLELFDVAKGLSVKQISWSGRDPRKFFEWLPDGSALIVVGDEGISRLSKERGEALERLKTTESSLQPTSIALSSDGKQLALGNLDGFIHIFQTEDWREVGVKAHVSEARNLVWSPNDLYLASGGTDRAINILETNPLRVVAHLPSELPNIHDLSWLAQDQLFVIPGYQFVGVLNPTQQLPIQTERRDPLLAVSWSPDGQRLAASFREILITEFNHSKISVRRHSDNSVWSEDVAWTPAGDRLLCFLDKHLAICSIDDLSSPRLLHDHTINLHQIDLCPNQPLAASTGNDGIAVTNYETGERVWFREMDQFRGGGRVQFNPTNGAELVFCGDYHHCVNLVDLYTGKEAQFCETTGRRILDLDWSKDGKSIATIAPVGLVEVWNYPTGERKLSLAGHKGGTTAVAFSPDGARIATSGKDGNVRLWDAESGVQVAALEGAGSVFNAVDWSPDGEKLAACDQAGRVWIWSAEAPE